MTTHSRGGGGKLAAGFVAFASLCAGQVGALNPLIPVGGRLPDPPASNEPLKPAPRLPDGRPDLGNGRGVWNPRVIANLSGIGRGGRDRSPTDNVIDIPMQPWAERVYGERQATLSKDDPEGRCLPPGVPRVMFTPFPFQIYQQPDRVIFIFEGAAHLWRVVYTDGRPHSDAPNPSFLGDSVGHWEGDTLVIDVVGFNQTTWLDQEGHPHTEALHVVERLTRIDETTLQYEVTIDDPNAYTEPWTVSFTIPWAAGEELLEYICQENNQDLPHLVGQ